ncbi:NAD-dependent epimerase/dehydratase family protein [Sphingomonas xanthus]|uniref:NAD-dependent epimerase/dehydratase family protein n=1 Tax=Sphingomonas xanthus TaxID=2594473 RepID=A0A516ISP7_9SPHN|nr:NAD-dependent epimerase/dehydratase family protein [Sphingomonas xanthus]QDP19854.1 NAD-dependent epimerase/dehydratase family protein [Sphingomonas xanthus]
MVAALTLAITGGTGFVGARLIDLALDGGHRLRALTRRPQPDRAGISWIEGALDRPEALRKLVEGADAVIHVAGVINSPDAAGFEVGNVAGTGAVLDAAQAAGVGRFVHVSSLAAREPALSMYGASKARSEVLVRASGLSHAIVRPPAVYGPGDRETLELFRMAKGGLILLPPRGRLSLIHVDDLARLLLTMASPVAPDALLVEPDDGTADGWTHRAFGEALAAAVGRRAISFSAPVALVRMGATIDRWLRGDKAKLTPDRAAYFCHPDWVCDPRHAAPETLWVPRIPTPQGLDQTARWYRQEGWL